MATALACGLGWGKGTASRPHQEIGGSRATTLPVMSVVLSLTAEELRVLACLIEKCHTTPDQYPLSTNALTTACNQKTSREPVVDYSTQLVDQTLQLLRDGGWVRMLRASGSRAFKHRHVIDEKLGLTDPQQAVFAVLALRGAQSPGELKTRTERYHPFADLAEVERVLQDLSNRDVPLTRNVGRASGQSQDRWIQLIGPTDVDAGPVEDLGSPAAATPGQPMPATPATPATSATPVAPAPSTRPDDADALVARLADLERRMAVLERELGLDEHEKAAP